MSFRLSPKVFNIVSLLTSMALTKNSSINLMSYDKNIYGVALVFLAFFGIRYILILVNRYIFDSSDDK